MPVFAALFARVAKSFFNLLLPCSAILCQLIRAARYPIRYPARYPGFHVELADSLAHIKFIDTKIRSLKPPENKDREVYWAEGHSGLGLRVGRGGKKTFISKLDFKGKDHLITHGAYPEVSIREAIQLHLEHQQRIEMGQDIARSAQLFEGKKIKALSVEYFKIRKAMGKAGYKNEESIFAMDVLPEIGTKSPQEITPQEVQRLLLKSLDRVKGRYPNRERAGQSHVKHMHVALRGFFRWLVELKRIESNPAAAVSTIGGDQARERVLSNVEIWKFWRWLERGSCGKVYRNALCFALVTGQRSKELRGFKCSHVDWETGFWNIGGARVKNKKFHRVALNGLALDILREQGCNKERKLDGYVFPGQASEGGIGARYLARILFTKIDEVGAAPFTPHDLRRTAATLITSLGLPPFYASLMLNHSQPGVTNQVYVHYAYDQEKKKAMRILDLAIRAIVSAKDEASVPSVEKLRVSLKRELL